MAGLVFRRRSPVGDTSFAASADHVTVTSYEARIRRFGSSTVVATQDLGKPTPVSNMITVNLAATFASLVAGSYTVSIAAISPIGTSESAPSNAFTLPLA